MADSVLKARAAALFRELVAQDHRDAVAEDRARVERESRQDGQATRGPAGGRGAGRGEFEGQGEAEGRAGGECEAVTNAQILFGATCGVQPTERNLRPVWNVARHREAARAERRVLLSHSSRHRTARANCARGRSGSDHRE